MVKDVQDNIKGIIIGGKNYTNLWYAEDAVFMSDQEAELQTTIYSPTLSMIPFTAQITGYTTLIRLYF